MGSTIYQHEYIQKQKFLREKLLLSPNQKFQGTEGSDSIRISYKSTLTLTK